ncbi:MAG TPA: hypothetical protein VE422_31650 [Terriglobia bacterium]|nr:hypothetical protein [Terriglobia bacterium]
MTILAALQVPQPNLIRSRTFQIVAPQGWKVRDSSNDIWIEHSTGASLRIVRSGRLTQNFDSYARLGVDRIMAPLGFAKFEEPRRFKNSDEESLQYEIRGNRLSERRRILYRAILRKTGVFEVVYESSEDRFDILLSEAQAVASSLELLPEPPPSRGSPPRRGR